MRNIDESEIDSLLEICNDPIFSIDTNYIINNINFEAAELFEKGRNELLNKHINSGEKNGIKDFRLNLLVTAASELARNILQYAKCGEAIITEVENGKEHGVKVIFNDQGEGIQIKKALQSGYSSKEGFGKGLDVVKRIVDEFRITSVHGEGLNIEIVMWEKGKKFK